MDNNVLLLIDFQREYNTKGRPFYIKEIEESLKNAQSVLHYARKNKWTIIHVKHYNDLEFKNTEVFLKGNKYAEYIDEFIPLKTEAEFGKNNYSCFSNEEFTGFLEKYKSAKIFVVGYNSRMCVLSTIIEGYHKGYKFYLVHDSSNAKADMIYTEKEIHGVMTSVLATFSQVVSTKEIVK
ncbi:isochorismatase family cysteine hydrolase [Anaerosinus gibii]|uniref:Cysteine hydrolase n=1 Tax=Selenobaculum gibii TaxID=3054208 RepID=A0A9Y2AK07_9FIRM|nr:isochorismatase family cysteine hydrolase [Selenobaculum gbiensis]WIW70890.1 cysteine hydrolase [Selenobaculum gbiensis]